MVGIIKINLLPGLSSCPHWSQCSVNWWGIGMPGRNFFSSSDFWDFLDDPEIRWSTDSELISIPNLDTPASEVDHLRGRGRLSHPLLTKGFHLQKFLPVKGWRCVYSILWRRMKKSLKIKVKNIVCQLIT